MGVPINFLSKPNYAILQYCCPEIKGKKARSFTDGNIASKKYDINKKLKEWKRFGHIFRSEKYFVHMSRSRVSRHFPYVKSTCMESVSMVKSNPYFDAGVVQW